MIPIEFMAMIRVEAIHSVALDRGDHDGRTIVLWPPSTFWEDGPKIRWWHPEACLRGCICTPASVGPVEQGK